MYHAIVLEDVLDLLQLDRVFHGIISPALIRVCEEKAQAMLVWLSALSHPDTEIALFNDAAHGIAPNSASLTSYAAAIGMYVAENPLDCLIQLLLSGYVRAQNTSMVLLCDVGEIGPDFQPGHGHADTLSCEASLFGARFIVNSGIDTYESSDERLYQRSTAAHSTVEVDGENSSEVWGSFRVARRAKPFALAVSRTEEMISVTCSHDGYCRLPGRVVHNRKWELCENSLEITDALTGNFGTAIARYFLHPGVDVIASSKTECELSHCGQIVKIAFVGGELEVVPSQYHPEFGRSLSNHCLSIRFTGAECAAQISWRAVTTGTSGYQ